MLVQRLKSIQTLPKNSYSIIYSEVKICYQNEFLNKQILDLMHISDSTLSNLRYQKKIKS